MEPMSGKSKSTIEFGDFQTPSALAADVCRCLIKAGVTPRTIIEPNCGVGNFLLAAVRAFAGVERAIGMDINESYVAAARDALAEWHGKRDIQLRCQSFFDTDWDAGFEALPEPILVIGNPPWVTNSGLAVIGSKNLPPKNNFQEHSGLDAITGKSNFDISEWMLIRLLESLSGKNAFLAMLCKTSVARKVLAYAWKSNLSIGHSEVRLIDAATHFGAAVDGCLLFVECCARGQSQRAEIYKNLADVTPVATMGYRAPWIIADVDAFDRRRHLFDSNGCSWRSGIKHDCAKVMELAKTSAGYRNGLGDDLELESTYLYPMLKSSDVAQGHVELPPRYMLVTQQFVGDNTLQIAQNAHMYVAILTETFGSS